MFRLHNKLRAKEKIYFSAEPHFTFATILGSAIINAVIITNDGIKQWDQSDWFAMYSISSVQGKLSSIWDTYTAKTRNRNVPQGICEKASKPTCYKMCLVQKFKKSSWKTK